MRAPADRRRGRIVALAAAGALSLSACTGSFPTATAAATPSALPQGNEPARLDPDDFTVDITNQYWPMKPGQRSVYRETDIEGNTQRGETTVLNRTDKIDGIRARVVHDVVTDAHGNLVEDTTDWFAQDKEGNLWYLGEQTAEYENGKVISTKGSWRAGKDDAQAGVLLPAHPTPGVKYREEFRSGEAEDQAIVLSTSEQAQTPTDIYEHALLTRNTTRLEPDLVELKWYAPGVGLVLTLTPSGGTDREEMVKAPGG